MRLLSLYASNFKKLKFKQPLAFPEGIVLITGLNESGKSTLLDAILYALYGRMMRPKERPSNEDIMSYGSGEAQVKLDFAIEDQSYRVIREVHKTRPSRAMLYELGPDGATRALASTVNDTTSEVERLLGGITYNEIVASSVVAQKDLERLIKQRLDDRRKVVNVFLNLDSFNKVQDQLGEERVQVEGTARNPGQLPSEKRELKLLTERLEEYSQRQAQLLDLDGKVKSFETDLAQSEKQFGDTDALHKTLAAYAEALKLRESLEKEVQSQTAFRDNLQQQVLSFSAKRRELGEAEEGLREFDGLAGTKAALSEAQKLEEGARGNELQFAQLKEREAQLSREIAAGKNREVTPSRVQNDGSSRSVWTYLAITGALGAGTVLSYLLSPLSSSLLALTVILGSLAIISLVFLARQIASLSQQAEAFAGHEKEMAAVQMVQLREKDLGQLRSELIEFDGKIRTSHERALEILGSISRYAQAFQKAIGDPRKMLEETTALYERDLGTQVALTERVQLLRGQLEEEPAVKAKLRDAEATVQQVKEKLDGVKVPDLPDAIVFSAELLDEASELRDSLNEKVSRTRTQIEGAVERRAEHRKFLDENKDLEDKVAAQERKVALLENQLKVVKYSMKGLEQTSESLRNRVKPQVERYMGLILPVITSGHYKAVELDEDYSVRVFDPEAGEFRPKEVFSGGTEDQLLLAMRLAFALALMPQAKGRSPEFLFLDEPLGSSDKVRREGILKLLREELAQNFRQIFLISHVGDLEAEADTIITMDNGTVREVIGRKPSLPEPVPVTA